MQRKISALILLILFLFVVSSQFQATNETVYITATGDCYHRDGCKYLKKSKIAISKEDAIKKGYKACKVCRP